MDVGRHDEGRWGSLEEDEEVEPWTPLLTLVADRMAGSSKVS